MMPRDVATRWNSTYDMLVFALEYRKAIDEISGDRDMRKYELDNGEWELVEQLCDLLEVRSTLSYLSFHPCHAHLFPDFQGRNPFLFAFNTQPCHCNTCDGSH
jgi:hypothetical protein